MLESYLVQLEPGGVWVWVQALGAGSGTDDGFRLWDWVMGSDWVRIIGLDYGFGLWVRILGEP